ncbi:MAG: ORF6N domain-containing protein [Alphaproteobacteria bacterium]|nr:ORF6N domain-containing protein [Alphaproteobacteria bacterium]
MESNVVIHPDERVHKIYSLRGKKVMFDFDLADLYGLETRILKQQVKRNFERFPGDFMFQLTKNEWNELITNCDKFPANLRHFPVTPLAFTEQGVAMLSSVLRSKQAIMVNIAIMRAFVTLRQMIESNKELVQRIDELERKYDSQFQVVFEAIRKMITRKNEPRERVGYKISGSE